MASEPDVHRAISLRPSPFHPHPYRTGTDSPRPESVHHAPAPPERPSSSRPPHSQLAADSKSTAHSTAVAQDSADHDPISRHATAVEERRASVDGSDVERQGSPVYSRDNDPFQLSSKLKTAEEIDEIKANAKANTARKRQNPLSKSKVAWRAHKLQSFYESQNENIERMLKPVDDHRREARETNEGTHLKYKIAVIGSFVANVILAGLQLYGAAASGSLSLFTTMADSLFDPLSNITLILCNRAVNRVDPRKFPSGKARIETAGNICFCFLMVAVSFIIIVMSCKELADGSLTETLDFHFPSVIAVCIAFATKLGLFFYCFAIRNQYSQVRILWEDHRNDLLINGFGVLTSVGGAKLKWWIDPMGAIILSCLITFFWLRTAYSEFQLLIGVTADTPTMQLITYICKFLFSASVWLDSILTTCSHDAFSSNSSARYCPRLA